MPELADEETERELAACRALLLQAREARVRPGWDDKVLADWNGLMIAAMANAGLVFERPELDRRWRAMPSISSATKMTAADGRLLHSWRAGQARHPSSVDDYANLCRAALALHEATGDERFLDPGPRLGDDPRPPLLGRGRRAGISLRRTIPKG